MSRYFGRTSVVALLVFAFSAAAAIAGNTYINDFPNVQVTEPDCYEFVIHVDQASGSSAILTLRVNDVDEESGELDEVYLNGNYLGYLSGTNDTWSTTSFNITSQVSYNADNTIRVCIDPDGGEDTSWRAEIDWGQILVDGGSAEDANITSVIASGTWDSIHVDTTVHATNADDYRLSINLIDSLGNNKDIDVDSFSLSAGATSTRHATLTLPSEPLATETFIIEASLFNDTTGVQQAIKTTTWTYSASQPPTDISLSSESIEENLPVLSLVGVLDGVDVDSASHDFTLIGGDVAFFTIVGDQLLSALSFDHEARENYSLHIEAEDGDGNTCSKWFAITVIDVNEAPSAADDNATVAEGGDVLINGLLNDTDPEEDTLEIVSITAPAQGSAAIHGDDIQYRPDPGACGTDSFSYTVSDGNGGSAIASVVVAIQNLIPVAVSDAAETREEQSVVIDVTANDSDAGNGDLSVLSVGTASYGLAVVLGNQIQYMPQPRFEGSDRFSYVVADECGATAIGWVDVRVLHANHPPTANAGILYQGIVDKPLMLDGSFSSDPDLGDTLQYRWDLDGDGAPDTDWSRDPHLATVYSRTYAGQVTLEVQDLYQGQPTGDSSQASAFVRIASIQSIQVFVFEDLNANGSRDDGEPGLSDIGITVSKNTLLTEADGGLSFELAAGTWDVAITPESISQLESRGYVIPEMQRSVDLAISAIETVALGVVKTSTKLKGLVYSDVNEDGEYNEDVDRLLQGLRVVLDDGADTLTDDAGRFFFLSVPFGEHTLWIGENAGSSQQTNEEATLNIVVPITLDRSVRTEFIFLWPWLTTGPEQGFLQIDIEKAPKD